MDHYEQNSLIGLWQLRNNPKQRNQAKLAYRCEMWSDLKHSQAIYYSGGREMCSYTSYFIKEED